MDQLREEATSITPKEDVKFFRNIRQKELEQLEKKMEELERNNRALIAIFDYQKELLADCENLMGDKITPEVIEFALKVQTLVFAHLEKSLTKLSENDCDTNGIPDDIVGLVKKTSQFELKNRLLGEALHYQTDLLIYPKDLVGGHLTSEVFGFASRVLILVSEAFNNLIKKDFGEAFEKNT